MNKGQSGGGYATIAMRRHLHAFNVRLKKAEISGDRISEIVKTVQHFKLLW